MKQEYPNPVVECPRCRGKIKGLQKQLRVSVRWTFSHQDPGVKILERRYVCPCGRSFWHEVAAKEATDED